MELSTPRALSFVLCFCAATVLTPGSLPAQVRYEKSITGTRVFEGRGGLAITMLVEAANLGSRDVEVGEITIPAGAGAGERRHRHGAIEIFYILSGELEHVVNGTAYLLKPGMVGIVRPGDTVVHRVPGAEAVRAVVIWTPGGEADRLAPGFRVRSLGPAGGAPR